jgi:hypothetical protein
MSDQQQTYQEKKSERENKKEEERQSQQRMRTMRKLRNYTIIVVIIGALGYGAYLLAQSSVPKSEDFSREIEVMKASHVDVGSNLPEYNSNPPTSGPHYVQTVRSGFRTESISDQNLIHNLEHGDIWIAYHPRISEGLAKQLEKFAAAKVVITPREDNEYDIALVAWGRLDSFNIDGGTVPEQRIKDFIKRYTNQGPERINGPSGGI